MARMSRQVHATLLVEARNLMAAMRTDPTSVEDWERCQRQWTALLHCARKGLRTAVNVTPADPSQFSIPVHKQGLRDLAEELGLSVAPFEGYSSLKERVIDELTAQNLEGR